MTTLNLKSVIYTETTSDSKLQTIRGRIAGIVILLTVAWFFFPFWMRIQDPTSGYIDQSIWMLLVFSILTFVIITSLCWWLLKQFWIILGLPEPNQLFVHFKYLSLCQQFSFFYASLALLLLAAIGCILAIC